MQREGFGQELGGGFELGLTFEASELGPELTLMCGVGAFELGTLEPLDARQLGVERRRHARAPARPASTAHTLVTLGRIRLAAHGSR